MYRPMVTKSFTFDTAHRVLGHKGRCAHLHGHSFTAEVTLSCQDVNPLGMVVDFGDIKETVGKWIDRMWDHNIILHPDDPLVVAKMMAEDSDTLLAGKVTDIFEGKEPYLLACRSYGPQYANPTAENLARELFHKAIELIAPLHPGVTVVRVRVYETPTSWSDFPQTN